MVDVGLDEVEQLFGVEDGVEDLALVSEFGDVGDEYLNGLHFCECEVVPIESEQYPDEVGEGLLIEGNVGGDFVLADDCGELDHVVRVVGNGVLDVLEELCLFLQRGYLVDSTPQLHVGLVKLFVKRVLAAVAANRHEFQLASAALFHEGKYHFLEELVVGVVADGLAVLLHFLLGRHGFWQEAEQEVVALIKSQLHVGPLADQVHDLVVLDDGISVVDALEVMYQRIEVVPLLML